MTDSQLLSAGPRFSLQGGITLRKSQADKLSEVERCFLANSARYDEFRAATRLALDLILELVTDEALPDLETKKRIAAGITTMLRQANFALECPTCGHPCSTLNCVTPGNSKWGIFSFRHSVAGKQMSHTTKGKLPAIKVIDAPPRKSRQTKLSPLLTLSGSSVG